MRVVLLLGAASLLRICGDTAPGVPAVPGPGGPFATPMVPGVVPTTPGAVPGFPAVPGTPPFPGVPSFPGAPGSVPGAVPAAPVAPGLPGVPPAPVPGAPGVVAPGPSPVAAAPGTTPAAPAPTPVLSVEEGRHHGTMLVTASARFEIVIKPGGEVKLYITEPDGDAIPISEATLASVQFDNAGVSTVTMLQPNVGCFEGSATPPPAPGSSVKFDATIRGVSLPAIRGVLRPPPAEQAEAPAASSRTARDRASERAAERAAARREARRPRAQTFEPAPLPPAGGARRGTVVGSDRPPPPPARSGGVTVQPGSGVISR